MTFVTRCVSSQISMRILAGLLIAPLFSHPGYGVLPDNEVQRDQHLSVYFAQVPMRRYLTIRLHITGTLIPGRVTGDH